MFWALIVPPEPTVLVTSIGLDVHFAELGGERKNVGLCTGGTRSVSPPERPGLPHSGTGVHGR
jgi:hypothetical protein